MLYTDIADAVKSFYCVKNDAVLQLGAKMSDLKKMSMSELIAKHNELNPGSPVTEFKSLAAGRAAVQSLENRSMNTETTETGVVHTTADNSKYASNGKRGPTQGVGAFAKTLIQEGLDNKTILERVLAQFPSAKTTTSCIAYYRTALKGGIKRKGKAVDPAALEAKAAELMAAAAAARAAAEAAEAAEAAAVPAA